MKNIDEICPRPVVDLIIPKPETWTSMLFSYGHIAGLLIIVLLANALFAAKYYCHSRKRNGYTPVGGVGATELTTPRRSAGSSA